MERVYEMAPEIAERKGDIWTAALRAHEGATGIYKEILDKGLAPIGWIDQIIAAVVFKAVYNAQRKNGASHDKAVREGKHVVALTQSASHAKDATRLMREKGAMKFFTIFTSDLAQAWGCVVYDIPAALKNGGKQKALALIATFAITKLLEQMVRDGGPDEWDDPWEWAKYVAASSTQNLLETVPLYGKVLSGAFDYAVHGGQFRSTSIPLYEGIRVLTKGARGAFTAKDKEKAVFDLMDGVGLLTGGVPTVFIRRIWKIGEALSEGEYKEALKEAIGMRRDERRTRRKIWM